MNLPYSSKAVAWLRGYEVADTDGEDVKYIDEKPLPDASWRTTIRHRGFAILGAIGAGFTVLVIVVLALKGTHSNANRQLWQPVPATTRVTFQPNYKYWNLSDSGSAHAWQSMQRNGEIFLSNPRDYGLPPGIERGDQESFALSVYHQLHCLKVIRSHLASFLNKGHALADSNPEHLDHCFDYIRQGIICAADMTVEGAKVDADCHRRGDDGWGTTHTCRDWSAVKDIIRSYQCTSCDSMIE